jgi:hypothetical protein
MPSGPLPTILQVAADPGAGIIHAFGSLELVAEGELAAFPYRRGVSGLRLQVTRRQALSFVKTRPALGLDAPARPSRLGIGQIYTHAGRETRCYGIRAFRLCPCAGRAGPLDCRRSVFAGSYMNATFLAQVVTGRRCLSDKGIN